MRLVRELIEETKEALGDSCAVAVRFAADAMADEDGTPIQGERAEIFALLAQLSDLWDISIRDYSYEMGGSRFVKEAALEPYMAHIKSQTSRPVLTVVAAFGVSPMPVRAAFSGLVAERELVQKSNGTILLPDISPDRLDEIIRFRVLLEGIATERAALARRRWRHRPPGDRTRHLGWRGIPAHGRRLRRHVLRFLDGPPRRRGPVPGIHRRKLSGGVGWVALVVAVKSSSQLSAIQIFVPRLRSLYLHIV